MMKNAAIIIHVQVFIVDLLSILVGISLKVDLLANMLKPLLNF
jgi:hypothetical protein